MLIFIIAVLLNKNPRKYFLLFVIFSLPFIDLPITPTNWGGYKVFDALSFFIFFLLIKDFLLSSLKNKFYLFVFTSLILSTIFGSLISEFQIHSLLRVISLFSICIYAKLLMDELNKNEKFHIQIIQAIKVVCLFSIIFLIIQMIIGLDFTFYREVNRNTQDYRGLRYTSFFHDPQKYQQFLAMTSFLFLINFKNIKIPKVNNYFFFLLIILAMSTTGGRSAFIGLFVGLFLMFITFDIHFKKIVFVFFSIAFFGALFYSDTILIFQRSETFSEDYLYRASLWQEAFDILKEHPFLGIGYGNFHNYAINNSDNYFINFNNDIVFFDQPESGYWLLLTELGIIGFSIIILFFLKPIFSRISTYNVFSKGNLLIVYIAAIISWMVAFTSVYSISDVRILIPLVTIICLLVTFNADKSTDQL